MNMSLYTAEAVTRIHEPRKWSHQYTTLMTLCLIVWESVVHVPLNPYLLYLFVCPIELVNSRPPSPQTRILGARAYIVTS